MKIPKLTLTEEEFKKRCAEILRENITFSGQLNDYVIHGALDELWKLFLETNIKNENRNKKSIGQEAP